MNTYNIYPKTTGRKAANPILAITMKAMDKGQYIFVESGYQQDVHSLKRSLNTSFKTKTMRDGKLKVLCTGKR